MKFSTPVFLLMFPVILGTAKLEAEDTQIPWDNLRAAAQGYLDAFVTHADQDVMAKKFKARVEQRVRDTDRSADEAALTIMFDWAADHENALEKKEPKAIAQVCFFYLIFIKQGYVLSAQIRDRLSTSIVEEIIAFLNDEVDRKKSEHALR